jgi:hypothetical protein
MRRFWLLLAAAQAWGCTNLPDIDAGVCGNGVEEADEDCDGTSASCRPPGSENACRFDCSPDGNGVRRACPTGYGCGLTDDVCRAHSGGFEALASPATGDTFFIATADFDADQRDDVLSVELNTVGVHFSAASGENDQSATLHSPPFEPAIGRFSDSGGAGFALASGGVSVQRGRLDHTLSAGAYAPFPVDSDTVAMGIIDAKPATYVNEVENLGSEVVAFAPVATSLEVRDVIKSQDLFTLDVSQSEVTNEIIHADLDPALRPGEELIVPKPGTDTILIFGLASLDQPSASYMWNAAPNTWTVKLEAPDRLLVPPVVGAKPAPPTVVVGFVNADGFPDLIALGGNDGDQRMLIALGDGNGQFYSSSTLFDAKLPDNRLAPFVAYNLGLLGTKMARGQPLAVDDLNGDGIPDLVVEKGINLSVPGSSGNAALWFGVPADFPWHAAAIGNFNGDDYPDVVAATHDGRRVDLHVGTSKGFNTTHISTNSKVAGFATGDFDGNLIGDVAVSETVTLADGSKEDVLSVLFGRVGGPLEPPMELGRFEKIRQIEAGSVTTFTGELDGVADIGVFASSGDTPTAALFVGDTQRRIESVFSITHAANTPDEAISFAVRVAAGNFDGVAPNDDLAIFTTPPPDVPFVDLETRLWLAPASGDAELSLATSRESLAIENDTLARCGMMFAALDLGGDELDELVLFGFGAEDVPKGKILVAHSIAQDGLHHFQLDPSVDVPEAYIGRVAVLACGIPDEAGESAEDLPLDGQVQVVDVDGDGHEDILSLATEVSPPPSFALVPRLMFFQNHYDGQLDIAGRVTLEIEGGKPDARLRSFVATQLDTDPEPEIVMVLGEKLYRGEIDLGQHRVVDVSSLEGLPQGSLLSTGDLNGDGVEDLVIAGSSGVNLARGIPVLR